MYYYENGTSINLNTAGVVYDYSRSSVDDNFEMSKVSVGAHENRKVDSWDSYASTFIQVVNHYRKAGGVVTPQMETAVKASFGVLTRLREGNYTGAKQSNTFKYLEDNLEVRSGLADAVELFREWAGCFNELTEAIDWLAAMNSNIHADYLAAVGGATTVPSYKWELGNNAAATNQFHLDYPDCQANLFMLMRSEPDEVPSDLWDNIKSTFTHGSGPLIPSFWLMAARKHGTPAEVEYYMNETEAFLNSNIDDPSFHISALATLLMALNNTPWY